MRDRGKIAQDGPGSSWQADSPCGPSGRPLGPLIESLAPLAGTGRAGEWAGYLYGSIVLEGFIGVGLDQPGPADLPALRRSLTCS